MVSSLPIEGLLYFAVCGFFLYAFTQVRKEKEKHEKDFSHEVSESVTEN